MGTDTKDKIFWDKSNAATVCIFRNNPLIVLAIFVFNKNETLETKNGVLLQKVSFITLKVGNTNLTLQKINNNIATNFSDVTFVHITHRLSSLVSCDRIVVINEGEIVGDGKFGDLLENNQSFIQLYKDQYQKQYL